MGWEDRNGTLYYYRKKRVDGRVVSEYIGRGEFADKIAQCDKGMRRHAQQKANHEKRVIEHQAQLERYLRVIDHHVKDAISVAYLVNNFHLHKGQWRKYHGK